MRFFLFPLLLLVFNAQAFAKLEFINTTPELIKKVRKNLDFDFDSNLSQKDLDDLARELYSSGDFEGVQILRKGNSYVVRGEPAKRIASIEIVGHRELSRSQILTIMDLAENQRLDRQAVVDGAERLKATYGEKGFLNTLIDIDFNNDPKRGWQIKIQIVEGIFCEITKIEFETNNEELKDKAELIGKKFARKPLTERLAGEIQGQFRDFFVANRYLSANLVGPEVIYNTEKTRATLRYRFDRAIRFVLLFQGLKDLNSGEIIKEMGLDVPNSVGSNPAIELAARVEKTLHHRGYAHAKIEVQERILNDKTIHQILFQVTEGKQTRIKDISFQGRFSRKEDFYKDLFYKNTSALFKRGYYSKEDFEETLKKIIVELQNQGYFKSRILSTRVEFDRVDEYVQLVVQLDEGPLTQITKIEFSGNTTFKESDLIEMIVLKEGQHLRLAELEESLSKLKNFYLSRGYLDMAVVNESEGLIEYSEDNTRAKINFKIHEGPQVRVASILIDGLSMTHEDVVLKEIEFSKGVILTPEIISNSMYRLQRTGLFGQVEISTLEAGTLVSDRTVLIKISEREPGVLTFGAGLSSEFELTVRGFAAIGYNNIGGTARAISTRVDLKRVTDIDFLDYRATAGYLEPFLLGTRTRGRVSLTRSQEIQSRFRQESILVRDSNSLEFNLEREVTRYFKVTWNLWTISFVRDFDLKKTIREEGQNIATMGPTLELDYRDNPFLTKKGTYTRLNFEYADPGFGSSETVQYGRSTAGFNTYLPIGFGDIIWANSVRGGYLFNLSHRGRIPSVKQFFLGGRASIRGFDTQTIPNPRAPLLSGKEDDVVVNTDSHFYLVQTEFRIPIVGDFETVVFYDGGAVKVSGFKFEDEYRDAIGIGFRYNTPVGPVSAEYGVKLDRQEKNRESEGRVHFSIGAF